MKRVILICLSVLISINSLSFAEEIKMIQFDIGCHITFNKETGKITGALYELLNDYIAPEMGVTFKWKDYHSTVPRIIASLEKNQEDATPLLLYSPERAKTMLFSQKPFFMNQSAIVVDINTQLGKVTKIEDILSMTIGYSQMTFITPFMRDERIRFEMNNTPDFMELNCKKLIKKRIQAVYAPDKASLLYIVGKLNLGDQVKCLNLPETPAPAHVVFAKSPKGEEWVERYNRAFDKINGQELYIKLLSKYLDVSKL